jgi:hypothetical protein
VPQTSYLYQPPAAFPGMIADSGPHDAVTAANSEPTLEMPFGCWAMAGAADNKALLPASSGAKIIGCLIHSHEYAQTVELGTVGIKRYIPGAFMRDGRIWVLTEEAVNKGDQVYARYAAGSGGSQLGASRKSADTSTAVAVPGCYYHTSTTGAGLAVVQVFINI